MENIRYANGHTHSKEFIISILENLGCTDIKDNNYEITASESLSLRNDVLEKGKKGIRPDFICSLKGKKCAVEVGNISADSKINEFLEFFDYVIHIYNDQSKYMMHNILYSKDTRIPEFIRKGLEQQNILLINMLKRSGYNTTNL